MKVGIIGSGSGRIVAVTDMITSVSVEPLQFVSEPTIVIKAPLIDLEPNIKPILTEKQRKKFAKQECKKGWKR